MRRVVAAGVATLAFLGLAGSALGASVPAGVNTDRLTQQEATADIVDTAIAAGSFDTLVAAVQAAGLEATLRGPGPFTVFAPTDAAFAALPAGTIDALLADPSGALTDILLYHVVAGSVPAADVVGLTSAVTVGGETISIEVVGGGVVLNGTVNVTATDVMATNGIIHVIDAVLMPPADESMDIVDTAIAAGGFDTLIAAVQAADLEATLRGAGPFTVFAPTDAAFAALPAGTIQALLADPSGTLTDILLYHVVAGAVPAADVVGLSSATTVGGDAISIAIVDGQVVLNGNVTVVATDVMASNGIIHVIDGVLMPPAAAATPSPADTGSGGMSTSNSLWIGLGILMAALVLVGGARMVTARQRA